MRDLKPLFLVLLSSLFAVATYASAAESETPAESDRPANTPATRPARQRSRDRSADAARPSQQAETQPTSKSASNDDDASADAKGGGGKAKPDGSKDKADAQKLSVTEHDAHIGGKTLHYRATAGTYPLLDDDGKTKADVFFVAYERLPLPATAEEAARRPITYLFNGGPGAAAVWLHLGTAGPQRVKLSETGEALPPPYSLVDNESSWLDESDLVFIDPVGTGFSRAAAGENPRQFYGVQEDLQWVSEFIRLYTTRNLRWPSPKFLAGESYGTTRAAGLSEHLLEEQGIALNGIVLISSVLDFGTIRFAENNELPFEIYLPTYTASAHYHQKLPADLQADLSKALKESEAFAMGDYAAALAAGDSLSDARRKEVASKLARLTGLPADTVAKARLRIDSELFRKALLAGDEKVIGRFDARITGYDPDLLDRGPDHDPSFNAFFATYSAAFNDYVRRVLNYKSDREYGVLTGRVQPWNYGKASDGWLNVSDDLARAMRKSPHTKLMICCGLYDQATPYMAAVYSVNHMKLNAALRQNISMHYYPAGHMLYHESGSLKQLKSDVTGFLKSAVETAP